MAEKIVPNFKEVKAIVFDFDGVFTTNQVICNQDGVESVLCSRSDGIGLQNIKSSSIHAFIVSSETNKVVKARAEKLGIQAYTSVSRKDDVLHKISNDIDIPLSKFMFVGNDINDLPALNIVGFPVAVSDAYPEIKNISCFTTRKAGGYGCVREICDLIVDQLKHSDSIKQIIFPTASTVGPRDWGEELLLVHSPKKYTLKKITILKGKKGGLQYHRFKDESGYVLRGTLQVIHQDADGQLKTSELKIGDWFHFPPYSIHQEVALTDVEILEVSTPHFNDRVRVEAEFNQAQCSYGLPSTDISDVKFL